MLLLSATNSPRFRFTLRSDLLGPRVLGTDPQGWDEMGVSLSRDPKAHGLTIEYTVQLGFVKDGRAYLERAYQAAGIEADVRLQVEQYDPNEFSLLPYYTGRVNLSTRELTTLAFKANVENESFAQKFLNRDTVAVDLLSNLSVGGSVGPTATPTTVELHSRTLVKRFEGNVQNNRPLEFQGLLIGTNPASDELSHTFYLGYAQGENAGYINEIGLQQIAGGFVSGDAFDAVPIFPVPDSGQYVVEFGGSLEIRVQGNPDVPLQSRGLFDKVDVKFQYRINSDPNSPLYDLSHHDYNIFAGPGYRHTFVIPPQSFTHLLHPTDKIYLYAEVYVHNITTSQGQYNFRLTATEQPGTYLRIRAQTTTEPTSCTGLLMYEAFDRVSQALTDEPDAFRSGYFGRTDARVPQPADGPGSLELLTGGFQLRGFPLPSAPAPATGESDDRKSIYATWRELFDSQAAAHALGYGFERTAAGKTVVRVENFTYFYPARVALDLTVDRPDYQAPTVMVTTKTLAERFYQQLEFGYTAWQAEQVNGLEEPNSKRQWTTPLTQVSNVYSQLSKYIASGQLLETTRRQRYAASNSTDNGRDNDNFIVCLLRTGAGGFETERNQRFPVLTGLLDPPSAYNVRRSPARNLRRHGAILAAGLQPHTLSLVRFAFGEGNNELVSQLNTETAPVAEKANIAVSELAGPLWRPEQDSFSVPVTRAQLQALLADPLGRVRYYDQEHQVREGWILDFKHNGKEQLGDFDLLPCIIR